MSSTARPLTGHEREVLAVILSADAPGAAELRAQLLDARARGPFIVEQGSLELTVAGAAHPGPSGHSLFPVRAFVERDGTFLGELLLWLADGRLDSVEYATVTDDVPTGLPDPGLISVVPNIVGRL